MERRKMGKLVSEICYTFADTDIFKHLAALALEALHKQVLPFLLRRLKEDVLNDLPPKIIQDYYCELSELQKHLYDDFSKSKAHISAKDAVKDDRPSGGGAEQQHIFQSLQYLRKLCNHPALVLNKDPQVIRAALSKVGSQPDGLSDIQHAPKLLALRYVLERDLLVLMLIAFQVNYW